MERTDISKARGERLTQARKARAKQLDSGLRQEDVAKLFGVAESTVCRWEAGADPGTDRIEELSKLYECSPAWLAFGEGEGPSGHADPDGDHGDGSPAPNGSSAAPAERGA